MTRKVKPNRGEEQLANVVLRPRADDYGKLDTFESVTLMVAVAAIIGGIGALAYLMQQLP